MDRKALKNLLAFGDLNELEPILMGYNIRLRNNNGEYLKLSEVLSQVKE